MIYDVAVVGSGPAGISAAIYAARGGLKTVVLSDFCSALEKANVIENYYGLAKPISGKQLELNGIHQAESLGARVIKCQVTSITCEGEMLYSLKSNLGETQAKCVILACGSPTIKPVVNGLDRFEGRGVSYCAVCDGFFFRGKTVCVLGSGEYAADEAEYLLGLTTRVTVLTDGNKKYSKMPPLAAVNTLKIERIEGDKTFRQVICEDGSFLPADGLFVAMGTAGSADFSRRLGLETDDKGFIITDENGATSQKGVFAAGDCTPGAKQICFAVAKGAAAGQGAVKLINSLK